MKFARANNRVVFKKDQAEITLGTYFDLVARSKKGEWITVRQGYIVLGAKIGLLFTTPDSLEGNYTLKVNPSGLGIKKIVLVDPELEEDDEDRELAHESSAILGLVNLILKKKTKPMEFEIPSF